MRKPKSVHYFEDPVYGFVYVISRHKTVRGFRTWFERSFPSSPIPEHVIELLSSDELGAITLHMTGGVIVFWFPLPLEPGGVAHEALHATHFVLKNREVSLTDKEAAPYYLQFVVESIYKKCQNDAMDFEDEFEDDETSDVIHRLPRTSFDSLMDNLIDRYQRESNAERNPKLDSSASDES